MVTVYPLRIQKGPLINYTYVVTDERSHESVIIDPGAGLDIIVNCIYNTGSIPRAILLTHYHEDHTGLASTLANTFNIPVYMSAVETSFHGFKCHNLHPFQPDMAFAAGSLSIMPWHTPGHTKGGVCYQVGDHLFTGDTLFAEGCGICFGPGADPVDMYHSLRRLQAVLTPQVKIYAGHCYGIEPGAPFSRVLKENIYLHLKSLQAFVAFRMRKYQKGLYNFK